MTNEPNESEVAVSPTLGKIDDLQSAAEEHRTAESAKSEAPHSDQPPYDEEDVTGGPTLGSINELRFAHHAHHPDAPHADEPAAEAPTDQ